MKNEKHTDLLPGEMADIKTGRIFEVPPGYFNQLNDQFFDQNGQYHPPHQKTNNIKSLRIWWVAASIAIVLSVAWWYNADFYHSDGDLTDESELRVYIQSEIMNYDLETLTRNLSEEDLYSVSQNNSEDYQTYIREHLEEFDDIIYNQ